MTRLLVTWKVTWWDQWPGLGPADVGEAESLEEGDVSQDFWDSIFISYSMYLCVDLHKKINKKIIYLVSKCFD